MHSAVGTMMKMSVSVLLVTVLLLQQLMSANALQDEQMDELWTTFKQTYGKSYTGDDDSFRKAIWAKNVDYIAAHNLKSELGLSNFTLGINEFSDWTDDEVHKFLLGTRITVDPRNYTSLEFDPFAHVPDHANLPTSVDWRTKGYVTRVKNQGRCGSCWAFSATGALEGQQFKKTGRLVSLSEQNLVDCSRAQGNHGCSGGLPSSAFDYVRLNGGIDTEASYPYQGNDGWCRFNPSTVGARCRGYREVTPTESSLMAAVATIGPISVAIDVTPPFYQYKQGVFYDPQCSTTHLGHAVLVVGYGTLKGLDYWIVKNSWGAEWGMNGYILMSRNRGNNCGIASEAVYPVV